MGIQLAPSQVHNRNFAELIICTLKNHLFVVLCSAYPEHLLPLWNEMIPQVNIILSTFERFTDQPCISIPTQIYGVFDNKKMNIVILSTKVYIHKNLNMRKT